jgi:hypothetical protein
VVTALPELKLLGVDDTETYSKDPELAIKVARAVLSVVAIRVSVVMSSFELVEVMVAGGAISL